jgi:hypothetical protein
MTRAVSLALALLLLGCQQFATAAEVRTVRLRWEGLGGMIGGRKVSVRTIDGARHKGRVQAVDADAILFEKGRNRRVARTSVAEIRMTEYAGNGRRWGKLIGGAVGLMAGLLGAVAVGLKEDTSHKDRNKALATVLAVGGLPAGLLGGYYLGRLADKEITVIQIIPPRNGD